MSLPDYIRAIWRSPQPGRLMGPGHPAGDFLTGPDFRVLDESPGRLLLDVPLVDAAKNFRGQLFGGFAPAYIDLIALRTVSAGTGERAHGWLVTLNLNVESFEAVVGPRFAADSRVVNRRVRTIFVELRFLESAEANAKVLLFATTMLLEQPVTP